MDKERKTDRRYAGASYLGEPGLSDEKITVMRSKAQGRSDALLANIKSVRGLSAEVFLRVSSKQEDDQSGDTKDLSELMMQWY